MKLQTLRDLLVEQLQDLYDAENRITKALPKMAKAAKSPELKAAFEKHLEETEGPGRRDWVRSSSISARRPRRRPARPCRA